MSHPEPQHLEFSQHAPTQHAPTQNAPTRSSGTINHASAAEGSPDKPPHKAIPLADEIVKVRNASHRRLVQISRLNLDQCQEVYLLRDNVFAGIRFQLGAFEAKWMVGESTIILCREGQLLTTLTVESPRPAKQAA